jgi:hypothetical protein
MLIVQILLLVQLSTLTFRAERRSVSLKASFVRYITPLIHSWCFYQ